jgi:hypothetical protein
MPLMVGVAWPCAADPHHPAADSVSRRTQVLAVLFDRYGYEIKVIRLT